MGAGNAGLDSATIWYLFFMYTRVQIVEQLDNGFTHFWARRSITGTKEPWARPREIRAIGKAKETSRPSKIDIRKKLDHDQKVWWILWLNFVQAKSSAKLPQPSFPVFSLTYVFLVPLISCNKGDLDVKLCKPPQNLWMLGKTLQTTYYVESIFSIGYIHEEQSCAMAVSQICSELAHSFAFEFSYRIKFFVFWCTELFCPF